MKMALDSFIETETSYKFPPSPLRAHSSSTIDSTTELESSNDNPSSPIIGTRRRRFSEKFVLDDDDSIDNQPNKTILKEIDKNTLPLNPLQDILLNTSLKKDFKSLKLPLKPTTNNFKLKDIILLNTNLIDFGSVYPGELSLKDLVITNKSIFDVSIEIKIHCYNERFNSLNEYVFSMTSAKDKNYNDSFRIFQGPLIRSEYRVAINTPKTKEPTDINGLLEIKSTQTSDTIKVPIKASIVMPS